MSVSVPGARVVRLALGATALFGLVQLVAVVVPHGPALAVAVAVSLALFAAGVVLFLWGFLVAAGRSRDDAVSLPGLYLLKGTAPAEVRRALLGTVVAQVVIAVVTAAIRPFTPVAFGILVPLFGVGTTGFWAARHGTFFTVAEARGAAERAEAERAAAVAEGRPVDEPDDLDDYDQLFRRRKRK